MINTKIRYDGYEVLGASGLGKLKTHVEAYLAKGWVPLPGSFVIDYDNGMAVRFYYQVVVRPVEDAQ